MLQPSPSIWFFPTPVSSPRCFFGDTSLVFKGPVAVLALCLVLLLLVFGFALLSSLGMSCVAIVLFLLELILSLGFTVITISRFPANNECSDTSNVNSDTTASVNSARLRNVGRFDLALVLLLLLLDKLVIVVVTVVVVVVVAMAAELLLADLRLGE